MPPARRDWEDPSICDGIAFSTLAEYLSPVQVKGVDLWLFCDIFVWFCHPGNTG
jgi:hypothetical protein